MPTGQTLEIRLTKAKTKNLAPLESLHLLPLPTHQRALEAATRVQIRLKINLLSADKTYSASYNAFPLHNAINVSHTTFGGGLCG